MKIYKKFINLMTFPERRKLFLLFCMVLISAIIDTLGVASIMPFMAVLANPELIDTNKLLNFVYLKLGYVNKMNFLFFWGAIAFFLLIISLSLKALTSFAQVSFTHQVEHSLAKRLMYGYLNQPYSWFMRKNSGNLSKNVLSEAAIVANGVMNLILLAAQSFVSFLLFFLLLAIDPALVVILTIILLLTYGLIIKLLKKFLARMGGESVSANKSRFKVVNEAFGAIKDIKIYGLEGAYVEKFETPSKSYAHYQAVAHAAGQLPKFALEAIAFGGMLAVLLFKMADKESFITILPLIAMYTFAAYRLMPALQQIYASITALNYVSPALNSIHEELSNLDIKTADCAQSELNLKRSIKLNKIKFSYEDSSREILKCIDIEIPINKTIGIVGPSGGGKSTIVDIILGILKPASGGILIDDVLLGDNNIRAWNRIVGYVPQHIYLLDGNIASNIAFGVEPADIDQASLIRAAKLADLEGLIENLPEKYNSVVGERGVRLSGGQRQRIGIARALYHNPQVLILDEATSALDNLTEQKIMETVERLHNQLTIVIIAHRLSTVQQCDEIFLLENGSVLDRGLFEELRKKHKFFLGRSDLIKDNPNL